MGNVSILSISKYKTPNSWGPYLHTHKHNFYQLFITVSGNGSVVVERAPISLTEGRCVLIQPNQPHSIIQVLSASQIVIDVKFTVSNPELERECGRCQQSMEFNSDCLHWIESARHFWKSEDVHGKMVAASQLEAILWAISSRGEVDENELYLPQIDSVCGISQQISEFVELNYVHGFTLDQISSALGYNKSYLCWAFKKQTGRSIMEHLNYVRISHAIDMVRHTDMNLAEISEAVGYKTSSHFCAVFRRVLGHSPGQLRSMEAQINRLDLLEQKRFLEANLDQYVSMPDGAVDPAAGR